MGRHGENIHKRKDGRWEARMICGYDPKGRAIYRSFYGRTYAEAREKRRKADTAAGGKPTGGAPQRILLGQVLLEWLEARKGSVKQSTYMRYKGLIGSHIMEKLGGYRLSALTAENIDAFLREKMISGRLDGTGGLSPKFVSDIRSVLRQVLEYARQQHYPCPDSARLFAPRSRRSGITVFSPEEQEALERVLFARPEPLYLGILMALYGGLRIGEVCALQWGDFSFPSGTVCISKTMQRIQIAGEGSGPKTRVIIDCPKTETSSRIVPLPSFLVEYLQGNRRPAECFLLTGTREYMEPRSCLKQYQRVLKRAGLAQYTFHALRHTFATRCVENGFDAKSLSEILGHANISTTLQLYVHPSMEMKRAQMNRLKRISIQGQNQGQTQGKNTNQP